MKIYLASRFRTAQAVNDFADELKAAGHTIVSTWHRTEAVTLPLPRPRTGPAAESSRLIAAKDLAEIEQADALILWTDQCMETQGGLWFEAGYAHGLGKKVFVKGQRWNIFCHLLPDWDSVERGS